MQMKRILFIDRDGTLIKEPETDFQVDSLEKLEFMPQVFRSMHNIAHNLDYELVMVSNQDGLGTNSFPEEDFWPVQNKMIRAFENEGIYFKEVHIDPSMPEDNAPTRKPGTEMLIEYMNGGYDLSNSYVIGDRLTDIKLAANLGTKAIAYGNNINPDELKEEGLESTCVFQTGEWNEIYSFLRGGSRTAIVDRETSETKIKVKIDLDGDGSSKIETGLGFFNHMLDQISKHANIDLNIRVEGDLEVDEHHTIEDTALALGEAIKNALGDKRGIERYGYALPMDESSAQVLIDFGGRPWLVWNVEFNREMVGDMPTEMFMHFFKSFSDAASCNLNIQASGENEHHKIEAIFKALARALKMAKKRNIFDYQLPSTKGVL